jgi:hypothetical protein
MDQSTESERGLPIVKASEGPISQNRLRRTHLPQDWDRIDGPPYDFDTRAKAAALAPRARSGRRRTGPIALRAS